MVAIVFALVIGLTPQLQGLLYGDDAPLGLTVSSAIDVLGDCCVPMILLGLGAKLSKGPNHSASTTTLRQQKNLVPCFHMADW